jgi:DNA modification methylase
MTWTIHHGDALTVLRTMPDCSVNCCVTSPPYWGLRDYGVAGQIGLEPTPGEYVARLVEVFREVRRVLADDGTCFVNLGDSYATGAGKTASPGGGAQGERFLEVGPAGYRGGHDGSPKHVNGSNPGFQPNRMPIPGLKPKDLVGIPWRVAFALQENGWWLRQDIIWSKPNPMPESVRDRCTKAHEYIFLLTKSARYWWDCEAVAELGTGRTAGKRTPDKSGNARGFEIRSGFQKVADVEWGTKNRRSVWTFSTLPTPEAHFATYPIEIPETCIRAGCPDGGVVLDPFSGAGTTGLAALKNGRRYVGIELNADYIEISRARAEKFYPLMMAGCAPQVYCTGGALAPAVDQEISNEIITLDGGEPGGTRPSTGD